MMIDKMPIDLPATWASLLNYLRSRREQSLAEAALLEQQIKLVEQAITLSEPLPTAFNPRWKEGARLTTLGRRALESAFDRGMRQAEVARLFRISMTRAHSLHREWRARVSVPEPGRSAES